MNIYEELEAAGVPLDHHESDLYAKVTPESSAIVERWRAAGHSATRFMSSDNTGLWFDIPFQYQPFWEKVQRVSGHLENRKAVA